MSFNVQLIKLSEQKPEDPTLHSRVHIKHVQGTHQFWEKTGGITSAPPKQEKQSSLDVNSQLYKDAQKLSQKLQVQVRQLQKSCSSGGCTVCGHIGHMSFQCMNKVKLQNQNLTIEEMEEKQRMKEEKYRKIRQLQEKEALQILKKQKKDKKSKKKKDKKERKSSKKSKKHNSKNDDNQKKSKKAKKIVYVSSSSEGEYFDPESESESSSASDYQIKRTYSDDSLALSSDSEDKVTKKINKKQKKHKKKH